MSKSGIGTVMDRIKIATVEHPIAVFSIGSSIWFDAVFADTVDFEKRKNDPDLIGVYHRGMDGKEVYRRLANFNKTKEITASCHAEFA